MLLNSVTCRGLNTSFLSCAVKWLTTALGSARPRDEAEKQTEYNCATCISLCLLFLSQHMQGLTFLLKLKLVQGQQGSLGRQTRLSPARCKVCTKRYGSVHAIYAQHCTVTDSYNNGSSHLHQLGAELPLLPWLPRDVASANIAVGVRHLAGWRDAAATLIGLLYSSTKTTM